VGTIRGHANARLESRPVTAASVVACMGVAAIQGGLVALPRPAALQPLARLRSPAWALAAPGSLLFGTFGVLALPSVATGLAILAATVTPVLAVIAVLRVVHGARLALLSAPLGLGVLATVGTGLPADLAASLLTALGCLTLGSAVVRLTPGRWLQVGVVSMAAVDVLLLALGIGQPANARLSEALTGIQPTFHHVELGPVLVDYPDLVLAAVLGGIVSGRAIQQRAALLVGILAFAYAGLLAFFNVLPATVPLIVALVVAEFAAGYRLTGRRNREASNHVVPSFSWPTTGGRPRLAPSQPTHTSWLGRPLL
jgi:hypothetical protein